MKKILEIYRPSFSLLFVFIILSKLYAQDHDYKEAFHLATRFFGAQRCGNTQSWIHGPCHTRDGESEGVDLEGGWHDCGDHVKFGQTNAYSAATLLMMYNRFPAPYKEFGDNYSPANSTGSPNGIPDVLDEVKIFTDYLLKACKNGTVYFQVGDGNTDHKNPYEPEYQSTQDPSQGGDPRYVYKTTATGSDSGASNFCGSAAAALALMSMSYREFDSSYADQCIEKAKEYYEIGDKKHESIGAKQSGGAYAGDYWADDMAFGAIEIYRATGEGAYLTAARNFHDESDEEYNMPTYFFMDYGNCAPEVNYDLYMEAPASIYKIEIENELSIMMDSTKNSMATYGYAHYDTHNDEWASLKYAIAGAMVAFLCHDLTGDEEAYEFGKRNVDFILGTHGNIGYDAPANFSFLIGYNKLGGGYPELPHHCAAYGRGADASWSSFNNDDVANLHELEGALVGGPISPGNGYKDTRNDPVTNEVGIYYNAPLVGALAYVIKEEYTSIKYNQHVTNIFKNQIPNHFKLAGNYRIDFPEGMDRKARLKVFDTRGRMLGIVPVNGRESIDLRKELGTSHKLLIVRPEIQK